MWATVFVTVSTTLYKSTAQINQHKVNVADSSFSKNQISLFDSLCIPSHWKLFSEEFV